MPEISWSQWQQQVFNKIKRDYAEILHHLTLDDFDWSAWRSLYDEGQSPNDAVDYALVRVEPVSERLPRR